MGIRLNKIIPSIILLAFRIEGIVTTTLLMTPNLTGMNSFTSLHQGVATKSILYNH